MVAPVLQRNIGVWLGLALIMVILGLDLVGGGNAELLRSCWGRAWQGPGRGPAGRGGVGQLPGRRPGTPDPAGVAATLNRSVTRAIGPEDFVTAVLVQVITDGSAIVLNCEHPPPPLVRAGQATELDPPEPGAAAWPGRAPEPLRLTLALGDRILLYTDGVSEARAAGGFFPLQAAAAFALVSADLEAGLESLWAELQHHVVGHLHDDVALLLLERSS
jgi:serine phosphatase RsbU (regulator of sigma subunit)